MEDEKYEPVQGILSGFKFLRVSGKIRAEVEFEPELANQCMQALGGNILPSESRHVAIVRLNDIRENTFQKPDNSSSESAFQPEEEEASQS